MATLGYTPKEQAQLAAIENQIQQLFSRQRVSNRSFTASAGAPSAPTVSSMAASNADTVVFSFIPSSDERVAGFNVYRSASNGSQSATRIRFIARAADLSQPISVTDRPPVVTFTVTNLTPTTFTYYYWVSAVAAGGAESALSGMGSAIVPITKLSSNGLMLGTDALSFPTSTTPAKINPRLFINLADSSVNNKQGIYIQNYRTESSGGSTEYNTGIWIDTYTSLDNIGSSIGEDSGIHINSVGEGDALSIFTMGAQRPAGFLKPRDLAATYLLESWYDHAQGYQITPVENVVDSFTIDTVANSGVTRTSNVTTIKFTAAHTFRVGDSPYVSNVKDGGGTTDTTFEGNLVITSVTSTTITGTGLSGSNAGAATRGGGYVQSGALGAAIAVRVGSRNSGARAFMGFFKSIGLPSFSGAATDPDNGSFLVTGSYTGAESMTRYQVVIDGTGPPNTFKYYRNGVLIASGVNCSTGATSVGLGVSVAWITASGHTIGATYTFDGYAIPSTQYALWITDDAFLTHKFTVFQKSGDVYVGGQLSVGLLTSHQKTLAVNASNNLDIYGTGFTSTLARFVDDGGATESRLVLFDDLVFAGSVRIWEASKAYVLGVRILSGGILYEVTTAGTTGATIPTFDSVTGHTTTDNTVTWTTIGTSYEGRVYTTTLTAARSWMLPDKDGTFAMTSDITTPGGANDITFNNTHGIVLTMTSGAVGYCLSNGTQLAMRMGAGGWYVLNSSDVERFRLSDAGGLVISGDYEWKSGTAFKGTLSHNNSADRTYSWGDLNGDVALITGVAAIGGAVAGRLLAVHDAAGNTFQVLCV